MSKRIVSVAIVLCLVLIPSADARDGKAVVSSLYERIEGKLARQPALAEQVGKPSPELERVRWLVGRWAIQSRVFAQGEAFADGGESSVEEILGGTWLQIRDSYDGQSQDLGFLSFNPVTKEWVALGIDRTGNAVTATGRGWEGNRLMLVANAEIVGERVVLRQTMEKVSDDQYRVLNEEKLSDGSWARIDEYVYTRIGTS